MTRLTEEMVSLRTKTSNLSLVKKLNIWGSGISDIGVIKKMNAVEILALSVNNISNLEPVRDLKNLETLYLRKNQIKDPNEILHLQTLPNLKALWLDDNPFCEQLGTNYRQTILRLLPNLKRLDDKDVTEYEVEEALAVYNKPNGAIAQEQIYEDTYEQAQQYYQQAQERQHYQQQAEKSPPHHQSERTLSSPQQQNHTQAQQYHRQNQQSQEVAASPTPLQQQSGAQGPSASSQELTHPPSPKYDSPQQQNRMSYQQQLDRSPEHDHAQAGHQLGYRERPLPPSMSTQSMKEFCHSERGLYPGHLAHSQVDLTEWNDPYRGQRDILERHGFRVNGMGLGGVRENGNWDGQARPHCPYHRRVLNRNSNLLSASLCLIKELDLNSLEVIEHAVRLRINELSTD